MRTACRSTRRWRLIGSVSREHPHRRFGAPLKMPNICYVSTHGHLPRTPSHTHIHNFTPHFWTGSFYAVSLLSVAGIMAFQSMISGAECSTSNNTLSQFLKHTQTDRSLQQDAMIGPTGISARPGFRTRPPPPAGVQDVDKFSRQSETPRAPVFDMHAMHAEMEACAHATTGSIVAQRLGA